MRKIIFALLFSITGLLYSQIIPYSHTIRVYHNDTAYIGKYYKVSYPYLNTKNFYIQIFADLGYFPYFLNYGNIYRYLYSTSQLADNMHNQILKNSYNLGMYGMEYGYTSDFAFSKNDTNQIIWTYYPPSWEPYASAHFTLNSGASGYTIFPATFMADASGVAVDPFNDSIMYCTFSSANPYGKNIWKTTNKGANWVSTDTITSGLYRGRLWVNRYNVNTLFFANSYNGKLWRSTGGGYNFSYILDTVNVMQMFFNVNEIYLCSPNKGLLKSTNNGNNWTQILNIGTNDMEVEPLDSNIYFAGTSKGIYKSTNKGLNWSVYNNSFLHTKNVVGLVKNLNSGDTIYAATSKSVYKVFGRDVLDTANAQYIPLAVGNVYVYQWTEIPQTGKYKIKIIKDSVFSNGYRYFNITLPMTNVNWIRYDSISGNIMGFVSPGGCSYTPNEMPLDSLKSRRGDTLKICGNIFNKHICYDTSNISVFGYSKKRKSFGWDNLTMGGRTFVKDFGLYSASVSEPPGYGRTDILVGCVINGVVYGDTTLTNINRLSSEIPKDFKLEQNFPNPFNSSTNIKFEISKRGLIELRIFDVNGKFLTQLFRQNLEEGIYNIPFYSVDLSSGVYFYTLFHNGNIVGTKKFILLK